MLPPPPPVDDPMGEVVPKFRYGRGMGRADLGGDGDVKADDDGGEGWEGLEEGTPEYIRRRYFPDAEPNPPELEWMRSRSSVPNNSSTFPSATSTHNPTNTSQQKQKEPQFPTQTQTRYSLHGTPLPPAPLINTPNASRITSSCRS